ncbi:MAG TPA: hypothetical protein VNR61_04815 [Niallia sp.]|nr:hypothetical protein [Niallia sp.]
MKSKKIVVSIALGIICIAIIINLLKKDLWDVNEALLREEVLSIGHSVETINLSKNRRESPFLKECEGG